MTDGATPTQVSELSNGMASGQDRLLRFGGGHQTRQGFVKVRLDAWRAWRALKMPRCLKTQDLQKMAMKTLEASGFCTRHVVGIYNDLHGFTMDAYHSLSMSIHVNSRFSPN